MEDEVFKTTMIEGQKKIFSYLNSLANAFDASNLRLDGIEARLDNVDKRLEKIEDRLRKIEKWVAVENSDFVIK